MTAGGGLDPDRESGLYGAEWRLRRLGIDVESCRGGKG